jgi:hypothetical protein
MRPAGLSLASQQSLARLMILMHIRIYMTAKAFPKEQLVIMASYLEPAPDGAPVPGGEDDGFEGVLLAVGELDDVPAHAVDGGREDPDLAAPDLAVGADVDDGVHRRGALHGEGPDGGAAEAVLGGVAEHDGAHEEDQLVD